MSTKSDTSLRRLSAYALTLLLFCASFSKRAEAQATPLVTGSFATSLATPTGLGTVVQTALDSYGDWLVLDYANGGLYEYPANGGAMITLAPAGTFGAVGGYKNPGITLDSANDLFIAGNFNNCLLLFPYDTTTKTWDGIATLNTTTNTGPDQCGGAPFSFAQYNLVTPVAPETVNYIQPWGLAMLPNNVLVIGSQDGTNYIFTLPVIPGPTVGTCVTPSKDGNCSPYDMPGSNTPTASTQILLSMTKRPNSVAADKFGNIYFVEDSGGLPGAYMIPAGQTNLPSDTSSLIVRIDPNLANVTAIATDSNGTLYISDSKAGVFMVPNPAGTPNPKAAVMLTSAPATGQVSVDLTRGILYVPTSNNGLAKVQFNVAEFGSTAAGTPAATSQSVLFGFNGSATPTSFAIEEAGATNPDFTIATGGTCTTGTAYAAQSGCSQNVTLSPHSAGSVSAKLLVLGASNALLGSITLHGTGTGSAAQVLPGGETAVGAGLKKPSQIAVDAAGNMYVADSGLGAVEIYPKGYGTVAATATVGKSLTAPTGVAVDGAGDVFIADSGNAIEVPIGATGLNAAGQVTLKTGLGTNLKLAADGLGHLYISDPSNGRVVELGNLGGTLGLLSQTETDLTGFIAPSAIAVDASGDLFVADGSNVIKVTPAGTRTTFTNFAAGATGLAVDSSGAVYVAMPAGTTRIPYLGGTLTASGETTVASNVTNPTSVAIDSLENVYVTDGTAENVEFVSSSATTNFGTLTSKTGTQTSGYTILDVGNSTLNVTGFTSTPDFSETSTSCTAGPVTVGSTCTATITFNPGPGDQGTLSGDLLLQSDAADAPVGMNVTGVGAALTTSATTITVTNPTVDGAPAVITVAPSSGTGAAPTGQITLTITGTNLTTAVTVIGTLKNGTVTLTPPQLPAGAYKFSVAYQGDRVYGPSTASAQVTVAVGAVTLTQPTQAAVQAAYPAYPYVLAGGAGSAEPYDSSTTPFQYTYPVQVVATDMVPLIGQPVFDNKGKLVGMNYGSVTYQGASTPGCAPISVAADGTAPFQATCFAINTSNNSIPDILTSYTITPVYSPVGTGSTDCNPTCVTNPNYSAVTGTPISFIALRNPMVQISSSPSSLTVAPGSTATATLTLTSLLGYGYAGGGDTPQVGTVQEPSGGLLNNYSLPVQLACDGLPAYATCSFSYPKPDVSDPNSVAVGPPPGTLIGGTACAANVGCVGPGTVVMTINTNISSGAVVGLHRGPSAIAFASMFGLGLLGLVFGKKKSLRGRVPTLFCLLLCCGIMGGVNGCTTKQLGTTSASASPAGTYQVLVTAKQVGSRTVPVSAANPAGIVYGNENQMSLPFTISVTVN
jgi:sugar lactone lactonase YvrE